MDRPAALDAYESNVPTIERTRPASPTCAMSAPRPPRPELVVLFELESEAGLLRFISTTTVFGTAADVTIDELAIESFFPADTDTAEILQRR